MDTRHYNEATAQPGLEVHMPTGLEVVPGEYGPYGHLLPETREGSNYDGKEITTVVYPGSYAPPQPLLSELPAQEQPARKRRLWLVFGGVIAALVIVGAVLGGVLGSRAARSSSGESEASQSGGSANPTSTPSGGGTGNPPPSNTTTARPESVRQGSALSVTGWRRSDGGAEMHLFFQDPQDGLRYSRCDTSRRTEANGSCWDAPVSFHSFAKPDTRLAASTLLFGDLYQPQTQLLYIGGRTRLNGTNFNSQNTPPYAEDSINDRQVFTGLNSSVTAYWPWAIYQDSAGELLHVRNQLLSNWSPTSTWDVSRINITARTASRLAIVPMSTNFTRIAVKGGYAIFYQAPDETLAVSITDLNSPQLDPDYPLSWQTELPGITLPRAGPFSAFSVARPSDPLQRVNTYVLYLDTEANINVLYTESSSVSADSPAQWTTTQPEVLRAVDRDTDIACLTLATSNNNAAGNPVLLEPASGENRCYFQRAGQVVEVRLDGQEWVEVGSMPIP
ncbi:Fucose-specific lectin [Madurella fahalii]|uniref:Fucose-specific lectin n=1 Tax=Madurella fahalii TaxID=1157608 RepID=A0ABQ0GH56_9PEZI